MSWPALAGLCLGSGFPLLKKKTVNGLCANLRQAWITNQHAAAGYQRLSRSWLVARTDAGSSTVAMCVLCCTNGQPNLTSIVPTSPRPLRLHSRFCKLHVHDRRRMQLLPVPAHS